MVGLARRSGKKQHTPAAKKRNKRLRAVRLDGDSFTLEDLEAISSGQASLRIPPAARRKIDAAARTVATAAQGDQPCYGINTGFGRLCSVQISPAEVKRLQLNLIRSHATGIGDPLTPEQVRLALALRANALARGNSGIRIEVIELLIAMLDEDVLPRIPRIGSVGASGDLAPLSHLALVLVGEGEALVDGKWVSAKVALRRKRLKPIRLEAKEGSATALFLARSCQIVPRRIEVSRY